MTDKWEPTLAAQRELAVNSDAPLEIVFLPGLLCNEQLWAAQIAGLNDIAHATVARLDTADSMEAMASSALNQAPSGAFMLVGLSMGGYVAFEIMRQQPQRVLGLALLSTSARPDMPETSEARRAQMRLSGHNLDTVVEQLLPKLLHPSRQKDTNCPRIVRSMAKTLGADVFKRQQEAIIGRPDSRPRLHEINCPTLVLCGRDDLITPPEVHTEIAEAIPGANLVIMDNCSHLSPLEQPEQVTRELRSWLEETQSAYAMR
ncbi:MAG TPA: alpha/beta hydrolase [Rhodocyclaceae bacterium]|nr:alpha/beta hydrolase [Rhodocyclaceae bacterium]